MSLTIAPPFGGREKSSQNCVLGYPYEAPLFLHGGPGSNLLTKKLNCLVLGAPDHQEDLVTVSISESHHSLDLLLLKALPTMVLIQSDRGESGNVQFHIVEVEEGYNLRKFSLGSTWRMTLKELTVPAVK